MKIEITRYTREDGVHIVLTKAGWLILCEVQRRPMRIWTGKKWEVSYLYEELDDFAYSKDYARKILKTIKKPSLSEMPLNK